VRISWRMALWSLVVAGCDLPTGPGDRARSGPEFDHGNVVTWYRMWGDGEVTVNDGRGRWLSTGATSVTAYPSFYMGTANPDSVSLTFSVPVTDLGGVVETVTAGSYCPTIPFTYAAYGTDGTLLNTGSFSAFCGVNWGFNVHTLEKIKRLVIYAAQPLPADYGGGHAVWFTLGFNVPCPPTGDVQLDFRSNREKFDSSFKAGNPNGPETSRKEHFRAGYRYPDGHVESFDLNAPNATNCTSGQVILPLIREDGGTLTWVWHSHPYGEDEFITRCGDVLFDFPQEYTSQPSGLEVSGQPGDWEALNQINGSLAQNGLPPVPMYIYDKTNAIRMEPNPQGGPPTNTYDVYNRTNIDCIWF
jgi:hypothetical protein